MYGPRFAVPHVEQDDVLLIGAEVQQVVIVRILIAPHNAGSADFAGGRVDFEFDAEIAVAADDFVEDSQGKGEFTGRGRNLREYVAVAGAVRSFRMTQCGGSPG